MSYKIEKLKNDIARKMHGTSINSIQSINNVIEEAGNQLLLDADILTTKKVETLTSNLYDGELVYPIPDGVKDIKIIDIRPQVDRQKSDKFKQKYSVDFDRDKNNNTFNIEYNGTSRTLKINKDMTQTKMISQLSDEDNITYDANITNLDKDKINYVSGSGSIKFNITGSGYLEESITSLDLSNDENISELFLWVYVPDISKFTSVTIAIGNDSSNYYSDIQTSPINSSTVSTGWNLFKFGWGTETGTVDAENIDYLKISFVTTSSGDEFYRVNECTSRIGRIYKILYYSKYLFKDYLTNEDKGEIDNDNDTINVDVTSYNLLLDKACAIAGQQIAGDSGEFDYTIYERSYINGVSKYRRQNKSEIINPRSSYYSMPNYRRIKINN